MTYLDNAGRQPSPSGTYDDFLGLIDDSIRESLRPEDAFDFMESVAGHRDGPCSLIILIDEMNAANSVGVGCCPAPSLHEGQSPCPVHVCVTPSQHKSDGLHSVRPVAAVT